VCGWEQPRGDQSAVSDLSYISQQVTQVINETLALDSEGFAAVWGRNTVSVTMTMDREYLKQYSMAAQHASQVDYYLPRLPLGPVIHRVRAFALTLHRSTRMASLFQQITVSSSGCTHVLRRGEGVRGRAAAVHRTRAHGLHHRAKGARAPLPTCSVCRTLS
jgi:hypothetical protein